MLRTYGRLPIPTREEQVLLGRAIRAWQDWEPSAAQQAAGITSCPPRIRRAGERAREQLVSRNMLLVAKQARSFSVDRLPALEVQDLIQEGAIGLCRAAELFDPAHGFAFSTFAVWWIRQAMTRLVHSSSAIRVPLKRAQLHARLRRWAAEFAVREGRSPSDAEAMEALALTPSDLAIARDAAAVLRVGSIDAVIGDGDGEGSTLAARLAAPAPPEDGWDLDASHQELQQVQRLLQKEQMARGQCQLSERVLLEVVARRLAGQSHGAIGLEMGLSERVVLRRIQQALAMAMAQWRLENAGDPVAPEHAVATGDAAGSQEATSICKEPLVETKPATPPAFWQPSLLALLS